MISVIIPAYNEEEHLGLALGALLAQTYKDVEIIVIDNASTDNTASIARNFPVTLISETRKGTMWACEAGRKKAQGTIIVRMDADCLPRPDWLEKGAAHFADSHVVAVTGPYHYHDAPWWFLKAALAVQCGLYPSMNWLAQKCGVGGVLIGGNSFMRADILEKMGGFDTSIIFHGDDSDVAKRMSPYGRIIFDTSLGIETSSRRFKNEGIIALCSRYLLHFLRVIFTSSHA